MAIANLIGGAQRESAASAHSGTTTSNTGVLSDPVRRANSAGEKFRAWLDQRTPEGVNWKLNFGFIGAVLGAASSVFSLLNLIG